MKFRVLPICFSMMLMGCEREPVEEANPPVPNVVVDTAPQITATPQPFSRAQLMGAWSSDGENFVWVIDSSTILFESDMIEHPYQLAGDTLIIDRGDPAVGMQRTRILRLTADTLVIEDVLSGTSEALLRLR